MSITSKIEWTETTWNPVTGCTKISQGCEHCYACTLAKRLKAMGNVRYVNEFQVTVHNDLLEKPLEWKKSRMIFVNSMSDLFHDKVSDEVILKIFNTMNRASWHTFQVLTKRPDRLLALSKDIVWSHNIWMGVTIESNQYIDRSEKLKKTGAYIKFISAEPLLEDLTDISLGGIDWLIVGGESGVGARPMEEKWVLNLKNKAKESDTAFFFKQWGGVNKKKTGKLLEGKIVQEYPRCDHN